MLSDLEFVDRVTAPEFTESDNLKTSSLKTPAARQDLNFKP
jgi:hypothetical protein